MDENLDSPKIIIKNNTKINLTNNNENVDIIELDAASNKINSIIN